MMLKKCLLTPFVFMCISFSAYAQIDTKFWFVAPDVCHEHGDEPLIIRVTAFDEKADVTISMPSNSNFKNQTQTVNKNSQFSFVVKKSDVENIPANSINNKGLLVESTENVSVYYEVANQGNPDKFTLKGENALGKEFFVVSQNDYENYYNYKGNANEKADIVATEDDTEVTIIPKVNITGHKAGIPFTINLNRGQTYCIELRDIASKASLAGTYIQANKDIAVTISDDSVNESSHPHDLIGDQMIPTSIIGYEYIAVKTNDQNYATQKVYVLATEDDTHIYIDGDKTLVAELQKGEQRSFDITNNAIYIEATKPVYAYQLCGLVNVNGNGTANELGSALLPTVECTGSSFVSFTRIFVRSFWVQILSKEKDLNHFVMRNGNGTVVDHINDLKWIKVRGTDQGDAEDTWYSAITDMNITTGAPYTIENTNGLFHLSVLDENDPNSGPGSVSYGYFSSYGRMKLQGPTQECVGNAIELSASTPMDSYNWFSDIGGETAISTDPTIQVTESGRYWLTAEMKLGGCEITDSIDVDFQLPVVDLGDDVEACPGETFTFTIDPTYSNYEWNNNSTGNSTTVTTSEGSTEILSVIVTDALGCSNTDEVKIDATPLPTIILDKTTVCDGQKVINTTTAEKYEWEFKGNILNLDLTQNFIIPEETGVYTVRVWNASGCMKSQNFTITVNPLPALNINDQIVCNGEPHTFNAPLGTGYTYLWNDGTTGTKLTLTKPGDVTLSVVDNIGCQAGADGSLAWYAPNEIDLGPDREECAGVSLEIEDPSIYSNYIWKFIQDGTSNETTLVTDPINPHIYNITDSDPSNDGDYIVEATDNNGCPVTDHVNVVFTDTPTPTITPDRNLCQGNSVELVASAGYDSYTWYKDGTNMNITPDTQNKITSNGAGSYSVDAQFNGCTKSTEVNVIEYNTPTVSLINDFNICEGTSAEVAVDEFLPNSTFEYLVWEHNGVVETDLTASLTVNTSGTYKVTAFDNHGCSAEDEVIVGVNNPVSIDLGPARESCENTPIILTNPISNATSYQWFKREATGDIDGPIDIDYEVDQAGTYLLKVVDINGCEASDEVVLSTLALPSLDLGDDIEICANSYTIIADNTYASYEWNNNASLNTNELTAAATGNYTLKVTNTNGCEAIDDINITLKSTPNINVVATPGCVGEDIILNTTGDSGLSYLWSNGETTSSIRVSPGTYWLEASNSLNCTTRVEEKAKWLPVPRVNLGPDEMICPSSFVTIDAGAGFASYKWHDGSIEQTITASFMDTINMVKVSDTNGCFGFGTKTVKHLAYEGPKLLSDTSVCSTEIFELDAGPDFLSYKWNDGDNSQTKSVSESGIYTVEVTDGCYTHSDTAYITHYETPLVTKLDTSLYAQVVIFADGGTLPYKYSLNEGIPQNENTFKQLDNGEHILNIIDAKGCIAIDTIYLNNVYDIKIPPFFTPNNDGINDRWEVDGIDGFPDSIIKIYDRFGKLLIKYKASDPGWDGRYIGQPVKTDDYWYVIELVEVRKAMKGHFTLKR